MFENGGDSAVPGLNTVIENHIVVVDIQAADSIEERLQATFDSLQPHITDGEYYKKQDCMAG